MSDVRITISTDQGNSEVVLQRVAKSLKDIGDSGKKAEGGLTGVGATMRDVGTAMNAWAEIAQKSMASVSTAMNWAREQAQLEELRSSFKITAQSAGQFGDSLVKAISEATRGTVSNGTIMRETMRALATGVNVSQTEMARLWEIARAKGKQYGRETADVFNEMATAITKGNRRALIELGFLPESFADAKTGADLLIKRSDALSVVFEQGAKTVSMFAGENDSAADAFRRFDIAVAGLKKSVVELAPDLTGLVDEMTNAAKAAKDGIKYLAAHKDEVTGVLTAYAAWKTANIAVSVITPLAEALRAATAAQVGLNMAVGANAYVALAAVIAGLSKYLYDLKQETDDATAAFDRAADQLPKTAAGYWQIANSANAAAAAQLRSRIAVEEDTVLRAQKEVNAVSARHDARTRTHDIQGMGDPGTAEDAAYRAAYAITDSVSPQAATARLAKMRSELKALEAQGAVTGVAASGLGQAFLNLGNKAAAAAGWVRSWTHEVKGSIPPADDVGRKTKELATHFQSLTDAVQKAFVEAKKFAELDPFERLRTMAAGTALAPVSILDNLGFNKFPQFKALLAEAAEQIGQVFGNAEVWFKKAEGWQEKALKNIQAINQENRAAAEMFGGAYMPSSGFDKQGNRVVQPSAALSKLPFDISSGNQMASAVWDVMMFGVGGQSRNPMKIATVDGEKTTQYPSISKDQAKKTGDDFGKIFSKSVAEALNSALTDMFRNGNIFEGLTRGITNAIQQAVSQSNPIVSATGDINFGNLGINLATNFALGWLQSPGRLLGGTKIHGGEVPGQADSINQQVANAIAQRDAAQLVGASSETIARMRSWTPAYAGYSWDESGDGFFSAKTKTYQLDATAANASLAEFSKLIEKANKEMRDAEAWHIQQQAVAKIYELGGNTLTAIKLRSQDAEKRLQEIRDSLSPITGSTFATMSGLTPEQKRSLEDAQYEVASATKALSQFTDSINNANKSLVLRFPGSETQKIINAPHIDDILLGRRGANPVLNAEELTLRQQLTGASVPGEAPLAARASTRKAPTTDGNPHPERSGRCDCPTCVAGRAGLLRPDPVVIVPPATPLVIPPAGPALSPPRGTPRAPNNGVPMAYAYPDIPSFPDETGFVQPAQIETSRRALTKDEFDQIEAVLKEYAAAKRYTGRSMSRSRAEALSPLDALDYTGRSKRIAEHLATSEDELASIQRYLDEQAAAIVKYSAEGDIDRAKTALERWKEANNSYIAKYDEITQEQAEAMATSAEQTKYYEGLLKSSREGWTSLALNQRFLSAAGMTDAHTGLQGGTVSTGMTFYSGYSPDQIKQFAANKQLQKQAWYYGQATATETDIAIREMKARAGGDYGELEAVAKLRHDDAAARVAALSTDLSAAQEALNKTTQAQKDYLEKYNSWRAINDQFNQARLDEAQTAIDQAALLKEKQDRARDDILGTLLTNIGEIRNDELSGRQVMVIAGGQPSAKAMLKQLRDMVDPDARAIIDSIIEQTQGPEFN